MKKELAGIITGTVINICTFAQQAEKPNVILILLDDYGYHQMGCYGSEYYETPNFDRIASEGMRFTNAYASAALSSPTRAALMTGKYPTRLHLTDWLSGYAPPQNATLNVPAWEKQGLEDKDIALPQKMKNAGYRTSLIGKWHVGKTLPGWDEVLRFDGPKKGDECDGVDCHRVEQYTDSTLSFIRRSAKSGQPFFCFLSHNAIHTPEYEDAALVQKYAQKAGSLKGGFLNPIQGAMVERLDNYTGVLLDSLKKWDLEENTLLIVFSDNGQYSPNQKRGASPLRGSKVTYWEGGFREPLLVRWKGKIPANSTCDEPVIGHDFLPTIAEICGFPVNDITNLDGKSFAKNLLENPSNKIDREYLCWHYPHWHGEGEFMGAIRKGDWKLIENFNKSMYFQPDAFELYNLKDDLSESVNLINVYPEKAAELYQNLVEWRNETDAQMPIPKYKTYGSELLQIHSSNIPVKALDFTQQENLNFWIEYDGTGTYLTFRNGNKTGYYVKVEDNGNYNLQMLINKNNQEASSVKIHINKQVITTLPINQTSTWTKYTSENFQIEKGVHLIMLEYAGGNLEVDKIAFANQPLDLIHDGEKPVNTSLLINFESEPVFEYTIEGDSKNQLQTPIIIENPCQIGINQSGHCAYIRSNKDLTASPKVPAWNSNALYIHFKEPFTIDNSNRYLHIMHWKERLLNQWLVYARANDTDQYVEISRGTCPAPQQWFDMVVDVKSKFDQVKSLKIILDGNWGQSDAIRYYEPTNFYYDEIEFSNQPAERTEAPPASFWEPISDKELFQVYPNPFSGQLNIFAHDKLIGGELFFYNLFGQIVNKDIIHSNLQNYHLGNLSQGLYTVSINKEGKRYYQKIIKQ